MLRRAQRLPVETAAAARRLPLASDSNTWAWRQERRLLLAAFSGALERGGVLNPAGAHRCSHRELRHANGGRPEKPFSSGELYPAASGSELSTNGRN
jgi:hypothetical protein